MKIGVFDTGKGGEFVASKLRETFPEHKFLVINDQKNAPYGTKTDAKIRQLTKEAIQRLLVCPIIIIACNTVTMVAIDHLRTIYPNHKFIGFDPAIKPAVAGTKTNKVMILATTATLNSDRYKKLKAKFAYEVEVFEPDCSSWARKIDDGEFSDTDLDPITGVVRREGIDQIVLGCTHYLAIEERIFEILPKVQVQNPMSSVARQLAKIISEKS